MIAELGCGPEKADHHGGREGGCAEVDQLSH